MSPDDWFREGYMRSQDDRNIDYGIRPTDEWIREGQDLRRDSDRDYLEFDRPSGDRERQMDDRIYREARQRGLDFASAVRHSRITRARRMVGAIKSDEEAYFDLSWYFR